MIFSYRESLARFDELSDIFSNENNQIASRNLLMKVRLTALIFSMLGKIFLLFPENRLWHFMKVCMKCQSLFSGKK